MENEKKEVPAVQELSDESLNAVSGGGDTRRETYNYRKVFGNGYYDYTDYEWVGTDDNLKYLCPNCHRPVHPGGWGRYFCDPCDESWFVESNLERNTSSGGWVMKESGTKSYPCTP